MDNGPTTSTNRDVDVRHCLVEVSALKEDTAKALAEGQYKILGADSQHPIVQIGSEVFRGSWQFAMGTDMIFRHTLEADFSPTGRLQLEHIDNSQLRLVLQRIRIAPKQATTGAVVSGATGTGDRSESDEEESEDGEPIDVMS